MSSIHHEGVLLRNCRGCGLILLLAGTLLGGGAGARAAGAAPAPTASVITGVRQFWEISGDARQQPHQVQLELLVCYYDPQWKLLWGLGDDGVSFIRCGEKRFPLQPGQRILIDGIMSPASGLSLENADVRILAENVPLQPGPWQFQGPAQDGAKLVPQLVSLEGFVNRKAEVDRAHVLLDLTVAGWPVQARVLLQNPSTELQCESAFIKVQGVFVPNTTPDGKLSDLALWVARPEDIEIKGTLATDPRFNQAPVPIETLPRIPADRVIRVAGTVWDQEPGHSLTIRDDTGQVVILTGQTVPVPIGRRVEAIGRPASKNEKWQLGDGLYRVLADGLQEEKPARGAHAAPPVLRLAEQVLELGNERAGLARPARLLGVVTWADSGARFFYLNDASGGVRVALDSHQATVPAQGQAVEVEGVSATGDFAPMVKATSATVAGTMSMPGAQDVTLEQALTGVEEGKWIELRGYLQEIGRDGPWAKLRLTAAAGEFAAYLPPSNQLAALLGSAVRLRGVCSAVANDQHELVGIRLLVPSSSSEYIQVEQAALTDSSAEPERSIASLRRFNTLRALNQRVRISGIVLLQIPGRYLYVQEGTDAVQVLSRDTAALDPGDRVDVVGLPGREGSRLVLREATCRRRAAGPEPPPAAVGTPEVVQEAVDGHLVRLVGVLLDSANRNQETRLMIQAGKAVFEAVLERGGATGGPNPLVPGSRVAVTGIYQIQWDEYRHPRAFQVQLRSSRDLQVLSRPSWWTPSRALSVAGLFALGTALGIGWVMTLRRRVREQTAQIRAQLEREGRLETELQRKAKLESLGVLAGGIAHDFNNLLTVIMGNLTLAKLDAAESPVVARWLGEAEQGVLRARDLTLQLLTFAKGGDPVRKAVVLSDIVREAAGFALHGSKVRCEFDFAAGLWPAEVDKGQIGQVVQNIVLNAVQAMPAGGVIRAILRNSIVAPKTVPDLAAGLYLKLTIADTGQGINPEYLSRIFDPYFTTKPDGSGLGLATVYSIVKRHQGRVEVHSTPGQGTTFTIWLPAAQKTPSAAPVAPEPPARQSGRVLLMDDEEAIRRSAGALLQRLGMEAVVVADGAQVLREYGTARDAGRPYDLVILDLTVPGGLGGRETMEKLLQLDPKVRALVSSGYSSDPVLAQYRAHGFLGIVPKPYDVAELAKVIRTALEGRSGEGKADAGRVGQNP